MKKFSSSKTREKIAREQNDRVCLFSKDDHEIDLKIVIGYPLAISCEAKRHYVSAVRRTLIAKSLNRWPLV